MPRHKQVTTCLNGSSVLSKFCTCQHCTLSVCEVCGAYEGGLTTDCPGTKVDFDKQKEVYETPLDYTDDRGWHLGESMKLRSPRFTTTPLPPEPPRPDPRAVVAPSIDWTAVDRITDLKHELSQKAIAWVLADRVADDHSATLARLEDEVAAHLPKGQEPNEHARELLKTLEYEKIGFRLANQSAEKCDDEFRQAARKLVTALEAGQIATVANDKMLFTRTCGCTVVAGAACPHFVAPKDPAPR
jgi:hypothetical protein